MKENTVQGKFTPSSVLSWVFGIALVVVGLLNMILVHVVPGVAYLLVSLVYFPPANAWLKVRTGFAIPGIVKVLLGIVIIQFTLGVSDLGDMID
ncbi:hypothetical protein [Hymenobacter sp. B81]|uniref:hypothetical protein n=1 Tax=Hymenobacter sp. B81 TaxID=3344878 RepID=UPI0037DC326F